MTTVMVTHGAVTTIALTSANGLNLLDDDTVEHVILAVDEARRSPDVVAVVLAGEPVFSGGAHRDQLDQLARESRSVDGSRDVARRMRANARLVEALADPELLTIAVIRGACVGAAVGWVAACDMRVAGERAFVDTAFLRLGLPSDFGATRLLVRAIGRARALDWLLAPRRISAEDAERSGFWRVEGDIDFALNELTERSERSPAAIVAILRSADEAESLTLSAHLDREAARFADVLHTRSGPLDDQRTPAYRSSAGTHPSVNSKSQPGSG